MPTMHRFTLLLLALALVLSGGLAACDSSGSNSEENNDDGPSIARTFTVTVTSIDDSYPYRNKNQNGLAYAINGEVGKTVTLERGKTYAFELGSGVDPDHPFYVAETSEGGSNAPFRENPAFKTTGTVTFSPPSSAPDSLFYQCGNHVYMGGKVTIADSATGGDDGGNDDDDGGDDGGY